MGEQPLHLIMGKGRQVKWFVCKHDCGNDEFSLSVFDENGFCFISPQRYKEMGDVTSYNIRAYDEDIVLVNNDFFYREPLCDVKFPAEP